METGIQGILSKLPPLKQAIQNMRYTNKLEGLAGFEPDGVRTLPNGLTSFFLEDKSGSEITFVFDEEKDYGFIFIYDHESSFNNYGSNPPEIQTPLRNLPEKYKDIPHMKGIVWVWTKITPLQAYATSAIWWENGTWNLNQEWLNEVESGKDDGGLRWGLNKLLNNTTVEQASKNYPNLELQTISEVLNT